ncbi:MAG: segregation/condensation protein A [Actinobacteria bacterium]|nr:segregation/condensation protein A [Actinomycetota bacterium]
MSYEVRLEVFEGPIDLLLNLITRQRVDIYEISLSTITEEYIAALEHMDTLDLEVTTGFLVVAATLLELKSARLLPGRNLDDVDAQLLEERDLLLARLVECSTFRSAGDQIAVGLAAGASFYPRLVALEEPYATVVPDLLARTSVVAIARAAARALAPKPEVSLDTSHVTDIKVSVRDAIQDLAATLRHHGPRSFAELTSAYSDRLDIVVRFLALLEMFKAGAIELGQGDRFGDITASWTGEGDNELLELVDEYTVGGE